MSSLIPTGSASGTGSMTLAAPVTNSNQTATLPDATGTVMVSGNMPAFKAYNSSNQSVTTNVWTKCTLDTETFDTNSNFASSRFTPTVAGYYQINAQLATSSASTTSVKCGIYKNGAVFSNSIITTGGSGTLDTTSGFVSDLVYLNGSTDYVELYGVCVSSASPVFVGGAGNVSYCFLSGSLVRTA